MKHTLLGAGGAIGISYAHELINKKEKVRLVSRSGAGMEGAETVKADLSNFQQTAEAVKGSDIVYLFAGLLYDKKVWAELWPKIMAVCTEACKQEEARFVFFDNVYMYGKVDGKMTEETPYNPWSKKGEVRAGIAKSLEGEFKAGNLQVIIARAADLY
ncbi:MAG: NAD-dependent epimerase/dehydratase family protein, partial [Bacteroidota bacterium]